MENRVNPMDVEELMKVYKLREPEDKSEGASKNPNLPEDISLFK